MKIARWAWTPAVLLVIGTGMVQGGEGIQRSLPLRQPLDAAVPRTLNGATAKDIVISDEEQRVAGMSNYVMRVYEPAGAGAAAAFSVYVGYYERQQQGQTIHSPKNCLPGAGWEPLTSRQATIATPLGEVPVNHYVLQRGEERALVLYWYQGRGRVAANEYLVKWHLLQDQALRGRSDEALVRIIVPITGSSDDAEQLAKQLAGTLVPAVAQALPS